MGMGTGTDMGTGTGPAEETRWARWAALLPPALARDVADCWDVGEQEAGLDLLVGGLLEHRVPISGSVRAEIAVAAEVWGMWSALAPRLAQCPGEGGCDPLDVIERPDTVPLPGAAVAPEAGLAGLLVVPWIACAGCGRVLARAHRLEAWGDLSYLAEQYVLFTPADPSAPALLFADDAAWDGLNALRRPCGGA